jgi:hypothetical protein
VGAVGRYRPSEATLEAMAAHPVVSVVLREWLEEAAFTFTGASGPAGARRALERLRAFAPVAERVAPGVAARVAACPVAPLLGHALRSGLLDELHWPALEEALDLLEEEPPRRHQGDRLLVREAWPALVLSRGERVLVVGPEGLWLDHTLRLPDDLDGWEQPRFRLADGELLVMWSRAGGRYAYWSSRPADVFRLGGDTTGASPAHGPAGGVAEIGPASLQLPGGGRATGGLLLRAGDRVLPPSRPVLGDGEALWLLDQEGEAQAWREYDPVTGAPGPVSLPGFLRAAATGAARLLPERCEVLPARPGLEESPFGTDGVVLGRWVRAEDDGRLSAGSPDGRVLTVPAGGPADDHCPLGLLRLPGGAEMAAVRLHDTVAFFAPGDLSEGGELGHVVVGDQDFGQDAGIRLVPPPAFWHALRPRDAGSSAVLRAVTDEQAERLLDAVGRALRAYREADGAGGSPVAPQDAPTADETVRRAVAGTLPGLADERLLTGVASVVREALRISERTEIFRGRSAVAPDPTPVPDRRNTEGMFAGHRPRHGDDLTLEAALSGIVHRDALHGSLGSWLTLRQVLAVNHVLSGRPADGRPLIGRDRIAAPYDGWVTDEFTVPANGLDWPQVLPLLRPLARRSASPFLPDAHREALRLLFEALAAGPLTEGAGALRTVVLSEPSDQQQRGGQVLRKNGRTVVILGHRRVDGRRGRYGWTAVDHDPSGEFAPVAHFAVDRETRVVPGLDRRRLVEVARLLQERGAAPWRPEAPAALVAATGGGLGPSQAAVLLADTDRSRATSPDAAAPLGVGPRRYDLARNLLDALPSKDLPAVAGALLPEEPAELWTSGPDLAAAGRVWQERFGGLVLLPEELAAELPDATAEATLAVLNPTRAPWLDPSSADASVASPDWYRLTGAVDALASLAYVLPWGHPLRDVLPRTLAALRRRLADRELALVVRVRTAPDGRTSSPELPREESGAAGALSLRAAGGGQEDLVVRPAALEGPDDPVLDLLAGFTGVSRHDVSALRSVLDEEFARALAEGTGEGAPQGCAQDPYVCVPHLVAEVAAEHGLGPDAAALYLQLLALPDPTDKNCARWTGWRPARLKEARAELAATSLVVEAKRSRAGRCLFLPGGWRQSRSPALPAEEWKAGLYPLGDERRTVPRVPVAELFTRAWARVRAGDAPRYTDLVTRATRR